MKDIKVKNGLYDKLKGTLLLGAIALGSYGFTTFTTADSNLELARSGVAIAITLGIVVIYRSLKMEQ